VVVPVKPRECRRGYHPLQGEDPHCSLYPPECMNNCLSQYNL
jgi:hypothetical protein